MYNGSSILQKLQVILLVRFYVFRPLKTLFPVMSAAKMLAVIWVPRSHLPPPLRNPVPLS
jgi:hypothetical protein